MKHTHLVAGLGEIDDCKLDESSEHEHEASAQVDVDRSIHEVCRQTANAAGGQSHHGQHASYAN